MRLVVVAVVSMWVSSAFAKPGAIIIPPAEVDIGAGTPVGDVDVGPATEVRAGVHWASLYWKPTPIDIGVGYVGSYRDVAPSFAERTTSSDDDHSLALHGMYFSAAYAIEMHKHWRTWVGARVEGMTGHYGGRSYSVLGGALRLAAELYSTGVGAGGGSRTAGFFAGAFALGVYVEGTKRGLPAELGPIGVGAGITMRVPFIAAVGD
jgi:hypothetical protein